MDLATIFYILGIISMVLWIVFIGGIIAIALKVKKDVENFKVGFAGKIMSALKDNNLKIASALGLTVASFVLDKMKKAVSKKA